MITYLLRFLKKTPYGQIFTNVFQKDSCGRGNTSCVQISSKFGRPEVGEIARCLPDKKKQNFGRLSRSRFCADRAQNLSGTAPDNILGVPHISSKSVHFRRSYSRARADCGCSALLSLSIMLFYLVTSYIVFLFPRIDLALHLELPRGRISTR